MSKQLVFNELSMALAPTRIEARRWMAQLVGTIRWASAAGAERALRSQEELGTKELCSGYPIAKWRNDSEVELELKQFFRSVTSKSPLYKDAAPTVLALMQAREHTYGGVLCPGLGAAVLLDGLALSLPSAAAWNPGWVRINEDRLLDDATIESESIEVRNADAPTSVATFHNEWLATPPARFTDGADLWNRRIELFPSLIFCAGVEKELAAILSGDPWLGQIAERLHLLSLYFGSWVGGFDKDAIGIKVTPESGTTLEQYPDERMFRCPDGESRLFSWHARVTPGAWRIYFLPDPASRSAWVGYVGQHLTLLRQNYGRLTRWSTA